MIKGRRTGTLTCGITLVFFGVLALFRFWLDIDFLFILSLWPVIMILLGIETLLSYVFNKEEKLRFDGGSVAIIIILSVFAIGMAGAELALQHFPQYL